uniref:R3H domain-containing protein n=1 Tax=Glossina pallidipes TaxID=7398 RepID=A0A1B0AIE7_GLOPL
MGIEKSLHDQKFDKATSVDLYRPPALRNNSNTVAIKSISHSSAFSNASCQGICPLNTTSITAAIPLNTVASSCNNSPRHRGSNNAVCVSNTETYTLQPDTLCTKPQLKEQKSQHQQQQQQQQPTRRERRPDRAVYIPRARRSQTTPPTTITSVIAQTIQQPTTPSTPIPATGTGSTITTTIATTNNDISKQLLSTTNTIIAASVDAEPLPITDEEIVKQQTRKSKSSSAKDSQQERLKRTFKKSLQTSKNKSQSKCLKNCDPSSPLSPAPLSSTPLLTTTKTIFGHESNDIFSKERKFDHTESSSKCLNCNKSHKDLTEIAGKPQEEQHLHINSIHDNYYAESNQTYSSKPVMAAFAATVSNNVTNMLTKSSCKVQANKQCNTKADDEKLLNLRIEDVTSPIKCDIEKQELQRASKEMNRSNRRIMKQTFVSNVLEIPDFIEEVAFDAEMTIEQNVPTASAIVQADPTARPNCGNEGEDDWESMYDESGECLDPKIIQELTTSVGKVKIEVPKMDYSAYLTKQKLLNDEEFPHVLEVSNFPVEFKNQDLLMVFAQYKESGFDIKWVDDTHALAVFSSSTVAAEVLTMGHPFVVLKPLTEATLESRLKAKKCAASLQPYRPRPETCAALARRLVTGALGVRLKTAAAERENEKRVLREAKERKLLAAKQREETWES